MQVDIEACSSRVSVRVEPSLEQCEGGRIKQALSRKQYQRSTCGHVGDRGVKLCSRRDKMRKDHDGDHKQRSRKGGTEYATDSQYCNAMTWSASSEKGVSLFFLLNLWGKLLESVSSLQDMSSSI